MITTLTKLSTRQCQLVDTTGNELVMNKSRIQIQTIEYNMNNRLVYNSV